MDIDIESWMKDNNYDIDKLSDDRYEEAEEYAEELAQMSIDDAMDEIGEEIVARFKIKKIIAKTNK